MVLVEVSIVTSTYNRASLLPRIWGSIKRQNIGFEWIVVDDASTDNTTDILTSFSDARITHVKHAKNMGGPNAGRNEGALMSKGPFVVFLDDDDELYPGSLVEMVRRIRNAESRIGVVAFQCVLEGGGRWDDHVVDGAIYGEKDIVCHDALGLEKIYIYRREIFDQFKLPEDILRSDGVFVKEVSKKYDFLMVAQPGRIYHFDTLSSSLAGAMISNSRHIALGYERTIYNHRYILKECPEGETALLLRALYRYAVAGCISDAMRLGRRLLTCGRPIAKIRACVLIFLSVTGVAKFVEKGRVIKRMKQRFGV